MKGRCLLEIVKYKTLLRNGLPYLVMESSSEYRTEFFRKAKPIVEMMNEVFLADTQTEEYLYEVCFNTKMKPIAVFEISHGTVNATLISPREVFQKALICGATVIVLIHNHPSGDAEPSTEDCKMEKIMKETGELIGIKVVDNIIIGKDSNYFSFEERSRL